MARPKTPRLYRIKEIINEEIEKFIFEIFDELISTEFETTKNIQFGDFIYDRYVFKTNSNFGYEVDFYYVDLEIKRLKTVSKLISQNQTAVSIGFTSINNIDRDIDTEIEGTIDDPYIEKTNRNEQYEVLGKVGYIINEFISHTPQINVYIIGKNTHQSNLNVYLQMFKKIFSNEFDVIEDISEFFDGGAYYFIKKEIK